MTTDTAHEFWNRQWGQADGRQKWEVPEPDVLAQVALLAPGSACLDLGCGVGRHALAMAAAGHRVTAVDAAPQGLAELAARARAMNLTVQTLPAMMTDLPFADASFDYVLAFNVLYHGDLDTVARAVGQVARVLRQGGTFQGTMLSARNADCGRGLRLAPGTWVQPDAPETSDKRHPHYFCNAAEMLALFNGFEPCEIADREHERPGSWHWHLVLERR